ncbi:ABC transporter ATP-binding protein [Tsukamurella tyrosinosolvens]|uniref:ABC transporter ATP-binding protein n=1 Tax=Tsukamurella tyrosinosolvens TaxID=57704 RepID=UPI002DD44653|nr:ATP-binding cassette domain-containing protein [Tsukamurella tyrosinosolvens]MEC4613174.1 ATP-binding cassette domain-containing protein [Tsukamurella tyrosinosolvens]
MTDVVALLKDVTYRRDGNLILRGLDLTVRQGEHWALLGPNGAGKSTLLNLCGAWTHPSSGVVEVLGHRLGRVELQSLRRSIGHVDPRHPLRSPLSTRDVVLTGITGTVDRPMRWTPTAKQVDRSEFLLDLVGLSARGDALWPVLSQGERGRALIARALVGDPQLLLLDEPTTGLDVAAREQLLTTIAELVSAHPNLSSILVTHHLEELPTTTTHALLIADGCTVASGRATDTITSSNVSQAFKYPIEVTHDAGRWHARARICLR